MHPVSESLKEYARGITGGLLFSLPLLYTMEVWWAGFSVQWPQLLVYVSITFLLLLGYNKFAGMHEDATPKEILIDSVEEIGIGFVLSLLVLWTLGRISFTGMSLEEVMGKTIIETMNVAIGVSVGTAQLGSDATGEQQKNKADRSKATGSSVTSQSVLAFCGSVLIAGNIAPTEEVPMIAYEASAQRLLVMVAASLLLGATILFFSNFRRGRKLEQGSMVYTIIAETSLAYIIAVAASAFMLWFFGRFSDTGFSMSLYQVIVLAFPAMLGASAGRLLIK